MLSDETLWTCTTCYNCQERCPRNIAVADTLLELRRQAVRQGVMLERHRRVAENLLRTGHAVPIDEEHRVLRREVGLEELPETAQRYSQCFEEVKKLLQRAGFHKLVGVK